MSRTGWKRRLGTLVGGVTASENRTMILIYHSVGNGALPVSEAMFREQVDWLAHNAEIVSLSDALSGQSAAGKRVAITFDDGYGSVCDLAAPILSDYGAAATVYLNTGWIGAQTRRASDAKLGHYPDQNFMTWKDAADLSAVGWTIGSHGVDHLDLTRQTEQIVEREVMNSKHDIEDRLGLPCEHFAYTWGRYSSLLQETIKAAGYLSAVSGSHGPVMPESDRFALPRIDVRADYEMRDFVDLISGRWDYLGLKHRIARMLASK